MNTFWSTPPYLHKCPDHYCILELFCLGLLCARLRLSWYKLRILEVGLLILAQWIGICLSGHMDSSPER